MGGLGSGRTPGSHVAQTISVKPFRDAFLASGRSAGEVAECLEWFRWESRPSSHRLTRIRRGDSSRLRRTLGIDKRLDTPYKQYLNYNTAVKLARELGIDPVDVGI